jgi:hypothetical protein
MQRLRILEEEASMRNPDSESPEGLLFIVILEAVNYSLHIQDCDTK